MVSGVLHASSLPPALMDDPLPLHAALGKNDEALALSLIRRGVDVNAKNDNGLSPVHGAAFRGYTAVLDLLKEYGANIFAQNHTGLTALHMAAERHELDAVKWLLSHGFSKIIVTTEGCTPYISALANYPEDECVAFIGPDPLSETILALKKISHAASLRGVITLPQGSEIFIEGFPACSLFYREWTEILSDKPSLAPLIEPFSFAGRIHSFSSFEIASKIHSKSLVIIPLESLNHAYSLTFFNNKMLFGDSLTSTIIQFDIDSSKVTDVTINAIRYFWHKKENDLLSCFFSIVKPLGMTGFSPLKNLALCKQKAGNCAYASSKTALRVALYCLDIDDPKRVSKELSAEFLRKSLDDWTNLKLRQGLRETSSMLAMIKAAEAKLLKKKSKLESREKKCVIS